MARIKVTPEQVRNVATQFAQAGQQSQQMIANLNKTINTMQPEWEGMTAQKFYQDFQTWNTQMMKYVEMLNSINKQLNDIATRFAQADGQG